MRLIFPTPILLPLILAATACGDINVAASGGSGSETSVSDEDSTQVGGDSNALQQDTPAAVDLVQATELVEFVCTFGDDAPCDDDDSCTIDKCNAARECVHTPVVSGCQIDGLCYLEGAASSLTVCKVCDPVRSATAWSDLACNDQNPCTADLCDTASGCTSKNDNTAACNDGVACTKDDHCASGSCTAAPCPCVLAEDCGAAGQCHRAKCVDFACIVEADPGANSQPCSDGDPCTTTDVCLNGACAGPEMDCSELDGACVVGQCQNGSCSAVASKEGLTCDDGKACSSDDHCDDGTCVATPCACSANLDCDDSLACTSDTCADGTCLNTPIAGFCLLDGQCFAEGAKNPTNACEVCSPAVPEGTVGAWTPLECNDSNACTADACDPLTGCTAPAISGCCLTEGDCTDVTLPSCKVLSCKDNVCGAKPAPDGGDCDDGNSCTTSDQCIDGGCLGTSKDCSSVADSCHSAICSSGDCVTQVLLNAQCDDDEACTTDDRCSAAGECSGTFTCSCEKDADCAALGNACNAARCTTSSTCERVPKTGSACDDGTACTSEDTCDATGACQGVSYTCSGLACQTSTCDGSGGCVVTTLPGFCAVDSVCVATGTAKAGAPCLVCAPDKNKTAWTALADGSGCDADGNGCTANDACLGGQCNAGLLVGCDDQKSCTADSCVPNGSAGYTCSAVANGAGCLIEGACVQAGALRPDNPCLTCAPATSATGWSPVAPGTACDADQNGCTVGDSCVTGACQPGPAPTCSDTLVCTTNSCLSTGTASYICTTSISAGNCVIASTCVAAGATQPGNPCQICAPTQSAESYSKQTNATPCNADSNGCTVGDACTEGVCQAGPTEKCNDNNSCTLDQCVSSPTGYTCQNQTTQTSCSIAGQCVADGTRNPLNPCQVCDPTKSNKDWSKRPDGSGCDLDGNGCTVGDQCLSGTCTAGTTPNCNDQKSCTGDSCQSTGVESHVCKNTANGSGCFIAGACVAEGTIDPNNPCRMCQGASNAVDWSARSATTACGDAGTPCRNQDLCDGFGACQDKGFVGFGTPCGEGATACSGQDTCSGAGACLPNHLGSATPCGEGESICAYADGCNGSGGCQDKGSKPNGTACNADNSGCTQGDSCQSGQCSPGSSPTCDDRLDCTEDGCITIGATGFECVSGPANGACVINGSCVPAGALNDSNSCLYCGPANPYGWSPVADTSPCDADGNGCTQNDACQNGFCSAGPYVVCEDGYPCTYDFCASLGPDSSQCFSYGDGSSCTIDGSCVPAYTQNPANPCQMCNPGSPVGWSNTFGGEQCDDGNPCSQYESCQSGQCLGGEYLYCDDGLECTTDSCVSQDGQSWCSYLLTSGCSIDNTCVGAGQVDPNTGCQQCDPQQNAYGWSLVPEGTQCTGASQIGCIGTCSGGYCYDNTRYCTPYWAPDCSTYYTYCDYCPEGFYDCANW